MLSNHLVWNKYSKSAESLDNKNKFHSSSSNVFIQQRHGSTRSNLNSDSVVARAVSPGHHLTPEPFKSRSGHFDYKPVSEATRDFQYNYIKDNKIGANINSIINSNSHVVKQSTAYSYTPVTNNDIHSQNNKVRSYSPILSAINQASFERSQAAQNRFNEKFNSNNKYTSFVAITNNSPPVLINKPERLEHRVSFILR